MVWMRSKHTVRLILLGLLISACHAVAPSLETPTMLIPAALPSTVPQVTPSGEVNSDDRLAERLDMVHLTIEGRGISDPNVLQAMRNVPRHRFVPDAYVDQAYADHPLPIGYGQTISQPYVVAWMTELLALQPGERVLEIGTGSGYQAAVLAEIPDVEVYTVEIVPELAERAAGTLATLGYTQVRCLEGDGYYGWEEYAPFDAIVVTAAPDHLPQPLVSQLSESGRLVIPIGPQGGYQSLWRFTVVEGELVAENLGGVLFVPFTGPGIAQP